MTKTTRTTLNWGNPEVKTLDLYKEAKLASDALLSFIEKSPTAWQAVATAEEDLQANGFVRLDQKNSFHLKEGDKGYFVQNNSALLAFQIGKKPLEKGFRIFGAHSDSPGLKIKPKAISRAEGVVRLAVEVYGGPLLTTWFDRPLSLAGRVILKGASPLSVEEKLLDLEEPILILPSLAIHMLSRMEDGRRSDVMPIEKHLHILPFLSLASEEHEEDLFEKLIARKLSCRIEDILDYELLAYEVNPPSYCGLHDCFISAGRLDNLSMFKAGLSALIENSKNADCGEGIKVLLVADNEEVGSMTKQGAAGLFARDLLERMILALGGSRDDFLRALANSFMISADLAHACHPNYPEIADPGHRPRINGGPVIKVAASQSYSTDALSSAVFKQLAEEAGVPYQVFVNRSDKRGGSTIGPITSSIIPMPSVDCGNPIWGMHSIRETGGLLDQLYMEKLVSCFFAK